MYKYPNPEKELIRKIARLEKMLNDAYNDNARAKVWKEIEKLKKELEKEQKKK